MTESGRCPVIHFDHNSQEHSADPVGSYRNLRNAEKRGWSMADEKYRWYRDQLVANGLKVETPSDKLRADLRKIGDTMTAEWVKTAGAEGAAIIEALRKP